MILNLRKETTVANLLANNWAVANLVANNSNPEELLVKDGARVSTVEHLMSALGGLEIDSRNLGIPMEVVRRLAGNFSFTLGLHRPMDGVMKGRTIGTLSCILRP